MKRPTKQYLKFEHLYKNNILVNQGCHTTQCRVDSFTNDRFNGFGVTLVDLDTNKSKFFTPEEFNEMQKDASDNNKPTLMVRYIDIPNNDDDYNDLCKQAESLGYIEPTKYNYGTDHTIIKCPFCQSSEFIDITTDTHQHQVSEANIHCGNCSQYLTNWAYGFTNTHEFICQLYVMNIVKNKNHEKD